MIESAHLFRAPYEIDGLYDHLFGGLFLIWGFPIALQLTVFLSLFCGIVCCLSYDAAPKKLWKRMVEGCSILGFLSSSLLAFQPWDELFINLRHAEHFATSGIFSFNRHQPIEGTVDFLFYFVVGMMRRCGIPCVEGSILLSLLGGWLVILACRCALFNQKKVRLVNWLTLALSFFPPLIFNAANGFSAPMFSAAILWSLVIAHRGQLSVWLLLTISVVPLIRIEGIYWSFLLSSYFCIRHHQKNFLRTSLRFLPGLLPFLLLSVWRWKTFHHLIPTPAVFKIAPGSLFFLGIGVTNLVTDLVSSLALPSLVVLAIVFLRPPRKELVTGPIASLLLTACFVLPYYSSGGDWFPPYWGRFLLPFSLVAFILAATTISSLGRKENGQILALLLFIYLIPLAWPYYSVSRLLEVGFSPRWILANHHVSSLARGLSRVHYLSELGTHLGQTTEASDIIASSEVATIMYYADREALDMLGVANPEIANQPLRESPRFRRRLNGRSELPHRIFRRAQPHLIEKYQPAILFTFDFIPADILAGVSFEELDTVTLARAIRRWERRIGGLVDPLYGGFNQILQLGYSPIIIQYPNGFCSLYFVSSEAFKRHTQKMFSLGFRGEKFLVPN